MPIAHICQGCGHDLARLRARIEPHYRLPIVRCNSCDRVSVRRPHPMFAGWVRLKKIDFALTVLVIQVIICGLVLLLWCLAIPTMLVTTYLRLHRGDPVPDLSAMILFVALATLVTDIWLRVAFSRFNYIAALAWWSMAIFIGQSIATGAGLWIARISEGKLYIDVGSGPAIVGNDALSFASFSTGASTIGCTIALFIIAPLGYFGGTLLLIVFTRFRRHLRARHRRSIRVLRSG